MTTGKFLLYADLRYKLTIVLYRIIEEIKPPTTVTSTFFLNISTNGVSTTSNPLFISSIIEISPALPKGLIFTNKFVFVCFNSEITVFLLASKNSI